MHKIISITIVFLSLLILSAHVAKAACPMTWSPDPFYTADTNDIAFTMTSSAINSTSTYKIVVSVGVATVTKDGLKGNNNTITHTFNRDVGNASQLFLLSQGIHNLAVYQDGQKMCDGSFYVAGLRQTSCTVTANPFNPVFKKPVTISISNAIKGNGALYLEKGNPPTGTVIQTQAIDIGDSGTVSKTFDAGFPQEGTYFAKYCHPAGCLGSVDVCFSQPITVSLTEDDAKKVQQQNPSINAYSCDRCGKCEDKTGNVVRLPSDWPSCMDCFSGKNQPDGPGSWSALGCIPVQPDKFIKWLLLRTIGLVGGVAFLLILYGSLKVVTSAGNPEGLNEGKDIILAAIAGLIFIIFSVILLKIIGADILQIPGFTP